MKKPGKTVEIIPFVMGSCGTWDPQNDSFMRNLCSRSYLKLFQKLCVSDTLRWSRDLFIEHVTGVRQYDPAAFPTYDFKYRPEEQEEADPLAPQRPTVNQQVSEVSSD
ncbi:hypothetical protein AVEN_269400-1 [Araneus ventricosus]|uniref:Uncharacterized protein n=1 Tax=Araneus ventricosus TaxID=182803 RepID=A0A4Y2M0M6_ARAVE|nr:hypothetical protein AVEN_269400-1 [Araneus ventricosus]